MKETPIIMSGNHPRLILDGIKTQTRRVIKKHIPDGVTFHLNRYDKAKWWYEYAGRRPSIKCPYGQVGDRLWVRETWAVNPTMDNMPPHQISSVAFVYYKATSEGSPLLRGKWRPSIFMPRWASRITLEITELWAELLRNIPLADAIAEGGYTVEEFIKLYLKINHLPDDANPWNWAIKYKLLGMGD